MELVVILGLDGMVPMFVRSFLLPLQIEANEGRADLMKLGTVFGGGGSDFLPKNSNKNVSKIAKFQAKGYEFVTDNTTLSTLGNTKRALGLFGGSTLPTWLDRK